MSIESILRRKGTSVATIAPEASIKRAADWLRAKNIGALVVMRETAVLGLVSEREIVHAFSRYGEAAGLMPVKEIMQYGVTTGSRCSFHLGSLACEGDFPCMPPFVRARPRPAWPKS